MTNSYAWHLEHLYGAICEDVVARYPDYRQGMSRDLSRLLSVAKDRGITVFTIDLPNLGKAFDKSLASGHLSLNGLPLSRSTHRSRKIPRLFQGLYERVFGEDGCLLDHPDPQAVRLLRQLYYAAKKLKMDCGTSKTVKAVADYFEDDLAVILPTLQWDDDDFDPKDARDLALWDEVPAQKELPLFDTGEHLEEVNASACLGGLLYDIQLVADITSAELGTFSANSASYKHGPGSVADQARWGNKFLFPTWPAKLSRVFPIADVAFSSYSAWADAIKNKDVPYGFSPHEPPSVLIAVPKTQKGPRLIAKEPIAHQWCQQGIMEFLTKGTRYISIGKSIDFKSQDPSRDAALEASRTGKQMTIDLSAASDRVSCWLIERIFRRNYSLLDALQSSRTRWIVNNIDKKSPKFHKLRKFSTMGSAVTFPIQSYVYTIIAIGCILNQDNNPITSRRIQEAARMVQVFGDDIIVPVTVGPTLIAALGHLGFKVNHDKTFWTGKFRESCGMDGFQGHDVTPAYLTQLPQEGRPESMIAWVEECINFFKKKMFSVSAWIESIGRRLPQLRLLPSMPIDSGRFAWPTPGWYEMPLRKKWDPNLQRWLYWTCVPLGKRNTSPTQGSTGLIRYFTDNPDPETFWSSEIGLRPRLTIKARWEPLFGSFR